jgi:deazaflavin-dependent oxidoreductase (nitroreductase family)
MPNIRWLLALITRFQRWLYLRTNGVIGASIFGITMLLLTTVGRKSGREIQIPLLYIEDGERLILIASNAGDARHPSWWHNLQANPRARVQVGRDRFDVVAHTADPAERARLWPRLLATFRDFARYERKTAASREIPVVVLERAPTS